MATCHLPSQDILRQLLNYDADTGAFEWRMRPLSMFPDERAWRSWNTRNAGNPAFVRENSAGYTRSAIATRMYFGHIVAWVYVHGCPPQLKIDHINLDRSDNRISNLRLVTDTQSAHNRGRVCGSERGSSQFKGVSWFKITGKWRAMIVVNKKAMSLGYFHNEVDAAQAYDAAAVEHFGEYAWLNFGR